MIVKNTDLQILFLGSCLIFLFLKKDLIQKERERGYLLREFA